MGASASSVRATQYGAGREEKSSPENYSDHLLEATECYFKDEHEDKSTKGM